MLCNLRTVRPIFPKISPKVAQDFKEESHESEIIARNVEGGRIPPPPPPPGLLGLKQLHVDAHLETQLLKKNPEFGWICDKKIHCLVKEFSMDKTNLF